MSKKMMFMEVEIELKTMLDRFKIACDEEGLDFEERVGECLDDIE